MTLPAVWLVLVEHIRERGKLLVTLGNVPGQRMSGETWEQQKHRRPAAHKRQALPRHRTRRFPCPPKAPSGRRNGARQAGPSSLGRRTRAWLDPGHPPPRGSSMAGRFPVLAGACHFGTASAGLRLNSFRHRAGCFCLFCEAKQANGHTKKRRKPHFPNFAIVSVFEVFRGKIRLWPPEINQNPPHGIKTGELPPWAPSVKVALVVVN